MPAVSKPRPAKKPAANRKPQKRVILLRTSERTAFKRCRWAWNITYNEGMKPKVSAPALRFGTLVHKALELRYPPGLKRGPHPAETFEIEYQKELDEAQTKFGFKDDDGKWSDAGEIGVGMLNNFVDTFGTDDEWEVVSSELAFQVPVLETKSTIVMYVGIIDGVWKHRKTGELWLRDWKTAKAIPTNMGGHLSLDEQPGSYWTFAPDFLRTQGILKPKQRLQGIDFLYMRKALKDQRPVNAAGHSLNQPKVGDIKAIYAKHNLKQPAKGQGSGKDGNVLVGDLLAALPTKLREQALLLGEVSADQPAPYFKRVPTYRTEAEQRSLRARVLQEAVEQEMVRRGKLQAYKNPGMMTCGGCGLKDVCELHEAEQDWEAVLRATFVKWDGYAEHEIRNAELR